MTRRRCGCATPDECASITARRIERYGPFFFPMIFDQLCDAGHEPTAVAQVLSAAYDAFGKRQRRSELWFWSIALPLYFLALASIQFIV